MPVMKFCHRNTVEELPPLALQYFSLLNIIFYKKVKIGYMTNLMDIAINNV